MSQLIQLSTCLFTLQTQLNYEVFSYFIIDFLVVKNLIDLSKLKAYKVKHSICDHKCQTKQPSLPYLEIYLSILHMGLELSAQNTVLCMQCGWLPYIFDPHYLKSCVQNSNEPVKLYQNSCIKGYYITNQKIACFVLNLKIINIFLKNGMHLQANCPWNSKLTLKF